MYPFGGVEGPRYPSPGFPNKGYPYTGFVGFASNTPFDALEFNSAFGNPASLTIDDLTFAAPEPSTGVPVGLGLVGLIVFASITVRLSPR